MKREIKQYIEQAFNERKLGVLTQIESYLNHKYPNVKITYVDNSFVIEGEELEAEKCRKEIEETLEFSTKKE